MCPRQLLGETMDIWSQHSPLPGHHGLSLLRATLLTAALPFYQLNRILQVIASRSSAGEHALLVRSPTPPTLEVAHGR